MIRRFTPVRDLLRNKRGTALVEFALSAPVFLLLLMGVFDYCWQLYAQQVLQGAVSQSGRAATLEGYADNQSELDGSVRSRVLVIFKDADVTFERLAYDSFDQVGDPEPFTDSNNNNSYDTGECFEDKNGNGSWDTDSGSVGNGNANDVVLYTASMRFNRILPVWRMLGQSQETTLRASTVLRNQPYGSSTETSQTICS